jgi:hypothetical protein
MRGSIVGDRVVFVCHENGEEYSPGIYIHWGGREALDLLRRAASRMNMYDASEASARLCGFLHDQISGSTGIALLAPPVIGPDGDVDWDQYSPGDAGVIVIDVLEARAQCFAGYLAGQQVIDLPFDRD